MHHHIELVHVVEHGTVLQILLGKEKEIDEKQRQTCGTVVCLSVEQHRGHGDQQ